uniref:Uncharacterized protein n=1 Tax=Tanacetum cinerariifolium TaxID=118510 RepID=A0A699I9B7_TANCI|nr:hypothetical protein [Tanacetum cinerariifolium]GEZ43166.1 hypothetical protein [Tanacetum cinerariifolium]
MSLTKAEEEEAAMRVHATYERLVMAFDPEPARRSTKRRPFEQLAVDTMQALKANKKLSRSQPHARGSSEGTGITPGVPNDSTNTFRTSSEGTGSKLKVPDEKRRRNMMMKMTESLILKRLVMSLHENEYVHDDVDEEMKDAEDDEIGKDDKEITDAKKTDAEKIKVTKVLSPIPEIHIVTSITTLLPPPSVTNHTPILEQQTTSIPTPPITTAALAATIVLDPLLAITQRVYILEKDVKELKQVDHSVEILHQLDIREQRPKGEAPESPSHLRSHLPQMKHPKVSPPKTSKETVVEPTKEVSMDVATENVVNDVDQPQDESEPKRNSTLKNDCMKVDKLHGYGSLEEIVVRRADRQLLKFKECDIINQHMNEIEDILLLVVQHKLFHLDGEVIVDLVVALRMFTRSLIIKKRVKDVQSGVESY